MLCYNKDNRELLLISYYVVLYSEVVMFDFHQTTDTGRSTIVLLKYTISCGSRLPGGGGGLPYMGDIGMCGTKGYGFLAVLVGNRISKSIGRSCLIES